MTPGVLLPKADTAGLFVLLIFMKLRYLLIVLELDHLVTNSILITFASVINENMVHMGIERYVLNCLCIILSGHPFYFYKHQCHYHYHCHYYYYYYYYYYYHSSFLHLFYFNVILIQVGIGHFSLFYAIAKL